ncbi:MAG: NUMOD4 domain-containing protein [Cyclobacteriaceae bacterium]|nr:NUMOD4 domain-containing protein [Cyclobacteriaceae bacterium]
MEKEVWKPYSEDNLRSKFLISNFGNVKSIQSTDPEHPRLLKGYKNAGYPCIPTRLTNGKNTLIYVHKLVAQLYLDNPNNYDKIIHVNGDKSDARASNLKWVDQQTFYENQKKLAQLKYTAPKGIARNAKLTESQVKVLKKKIHDPNRKTRYKMLAKQFGVSVGTIFAIKRGERWKNIV